MDNQKNKVQIIERMKATLFIQRVRVILHLQAGASHEQMNDFKGPETQMTSELNRHNRRHRLCLTNDNSVSEKM